MATLQKLRNMGPLLVIFVGLALFAFIAGDAWRLFQTDSMEASVGTIDNESLSAEDFQTIYKECENAQRMFKLADPRLTEEQRNASFGEEEMAIIKEGFQKHPLQRICILHLINQDMVVLASNEIPKFLIFLKQSSYCREHIIVIKISMFNFIFNIALYDFCNDYSCFLNKFIYLLTMHQRIYLGFNRGC